ncbi:cysteine synthase family protein [Fibrobacter succinogenes subsp. succinogenes S85]|uniref:Cysteine synthase family protein n=1 Tax=Fibrobacter succinogenes (strain ATCC 19169 / S85) TaxID=59374 RepID=C9RQ23_FIBSS|nr:cysteine synthase family protein [Fibrobacter succinogenes]ACX74700.1 Pyridoxal-5'-phosphate-dependent protein beta subunit [Fibrobacter succinogenes subsp. succinogenes S85]ADL24634.1 cysteine synthase family protein [Fibrobacter succinogenes subsp. succinogenes S85]
MSNIHHSITELVGHTPLLELHNFEKNHNAKGHILAKLEYFNPSGSVKDRAALRMIEEAEREGKLKPGGEIVEITSGNTGIGLAAIAAAKGYKLTVFFEPGGSEERIQVIKTYGATLLGYDALPNVSKLLKEGSFSVAVLLSDVRKYAEEHNAFFINQIENENNPLAHYYTTGPEIVADTDGKVDFIVSMAGTGGTLNGLSKYFREHNPNVKIVGVQATPDSRFFTPEAEEHGVIDGVAPFANVPEPPPLLNDSSIYDEYIEVSTLQATGVAHELAEKEGLFLGTSGAAGIYAASIVAARPENEGKNIVVITADNGFKYLSTKVYALKK